MTPAVLFSTFRRYRIGTGIIKRRQKTSLRAPVSTKAPSPRGRVRIRLGPVQDGKPRSAVAMEIFYTRYACDGTFDRILANPPLLTKGSFACLARQPASARHGEQFPSPARHHPSDLKLRTPTWSFLRSQREYSGYLVNVGYVVPIPTSWNSGSNSLPPGFRICLRIATGRPQRDFGEPLPL